MYLPILTPIGAIDGMFGYGSPASPCPLLEPEDWALAPTAQAQMLATIRRARKNLGVRLFLVAVYSLECIERWSSTAVPKKRRRSHWISLDIFQPPV
jgi:hypothetical protein